jgi:hypothetical protein
MKKLLFLALLATVSITSCSKEEVAPQSVCVNGKRNISVQCSAIAASTGVRCLNKTYNCSGLCAQHETVTGGSKF